MDETRSDGLQQRDAVARALASPPAGAVAGEELSRGDTSLLGSSPYGMGEVPLVQIDTGHVMCLSLIHI